MTPAAASALTPAQLDAIRSTDGSILVSAAAGSGKTTVLAERCVALVCDVEPARRCSIDELLVVTFTDAAAEEMRARIRTTLRRRLDAAPDDVHLLRQIYSLEAASISTIHSFCKTIIERYFPQAGVDPQASILSEEEADLLREEVLDELFLALYSSNEPEALAFQGMVDDYGGGDDRIVGQTVLQIHNFISTLPDPDGWLDQSLARLDPACPTGLLASLDTCQCDRLRRELAAQIDYGRHLAAVIRDAWPVAAMHADGIDEHCRRLEDWHAALKPAAPACWAPVAWDIREFVFKRAAARPPKLDDEAKAAFDAAKKLRDEAKALFKTRLQDRLCRFTAEEYRQGLERVGPYARTLVYLVRAFDRRYSEAKSAQASLDFNDLQRRACVVLTDEEDPRRPSAVARRLQRKYRYVLVDEFQDIDPLQERILRFVSREAAEPPAGNLFTVGDIKQSIYRFRLAEPRLFAARADEFAGNSSIGRLIHLQQNFRSRAEIIDAINLVFEPLMSRPFGGSEYDDHARLHVGAAYPKAAGAEAGAARGFARPAVELHVLEPVTEQTRAQHDADAGPADIQADEEADALGNPSPESEMAGIEREAYLIGRLIRGWMRGPNRTASAAPAPPPSAALEPCRRMVAEKGKTPIDPPVLRPLEYRDIVILLRSLPQKAEPIADILRRMGLPVRIERQAGNLETTEFRDCLSALRLMDNAQQDIPLAAVLRSPLLGDAFSEADLLELRLINREVPFYAAVRLYAGEGDNAALRQRVVRILAILERYRERMQQTPVADALWGLFEEFNYLAYVGGLPDGMRRRDTLLRLHELARQFGRFSRQGLRRFLKFLDELTASQRQPRQPGIGGDDGCIRIMTVHASKGLEFPVVILADLQKRFNLEDLRGNVLVDRELGLALRAADPGRRVFYPTLAHQLAVENAQRESLSEELRVLYVALTRAREHLVITGRLNPDRVAVYRSMSRARQANSKPAALPRLQLEGAGSPLEWLLAALGTAPSATVHWPGAAADKPVDADPKDAPRPAREQAVTDPRTPDAAHRTAPLFTVNTYARQTTDAWRIPPAVEPQRAAALAALADLQPMPKSEPLGELDAARRLVASLSVPYAARTLSTIPARVPVSELKRSWDATFDPDERGPRSLKSAEPPRPAFITRSRALDAAGRGTATHRFLQLVDLARPCTADDLADQLRALLGSGRISAADGEAVMIDAAAWFMEADLGRRLRASAHAVQREVAFDARIEPSRYDPRVTTADPRDAVLVRGMVDLVLALPDQIEIVDYKTDAVTGEQMAARAEAYRPQLEIYAHALRAAHRTKVARCWLVFLHPRQIVEITSAHT